VRADGKAVVRPLRFDQFHANIQGLYFGGCDHIHLSAGKKEFKGVKKAFESALKHIHATGKMDGKMMADKPIKGLIKATFDVLKESMSEIKTVISDTIRNSFENDIFIFSGMKSYASLKEAAQLLKDPNGTIKPFEQFKKDIVDIDSTYNQRYLESEYNYAVGSAQMADKWIQQEQTEGEYDLQYRTAGDDHVRPAHAKLADITLPRTDKFWIKYYPPNDWGCRCLAVLVKTGKYTITDSKTANELGDVATTRLDKDGNNAADIFRYNPGMQKVIFPPNHPYTAKGNADKKEAKDTLTKKVK